MARAFNALTRKLRRLLGNKPSRQAHRPEKHKTITRWLAVERLEDRVVPADVSYTALANGIAAHLNTVSARARDFAEQSTAALPILGSSLADRASKVESVVVDIQKAIQPALNKLDGKNPGQEDIRTALVNSGIVRDLDGGGVGNSDVLIPIDKFDPSHGNITITVKLGGKLDLSSQNLNFDLGLPGVPFALTGNAKLTVGLDVEYDRLSFGMRNNAFFVESPPRASGESNTVTITLDASAGKNANLIGTIGFFQVKGEVLPGYGKAAYVSAGLKFDANGTTFSSPRLTGTAAVNMNLDATIVTNSTGLTFPHMKTDFQMYWDLGGTNIANRDSLGTAPSVQFNNIQFGLGSFLGSMVKPIVEKVQQITAPLKPVYELLQTPLPGLSDLSEAAGTGPITLDKLANLAVASKVLPPDYQLLADIGIKLHNLSELIQNAKFGSGNNQNDVLIPVGSFNLSGNGDLRKATLNGGFTTLQQWAQAGISNLNLKDLTNLVPAAIGVSESIEKKISTGNLPPAFRDVVQDTFKKINETLRRLQNGIGLTFPLLDNPVSIYKLLLGQDVDFVRFDAKFEGTASQKDKLKVLDPITAEFDGTINLNAELHAGVDTFGLRTFFMDIATGKAADPSKLDDGLYVDSSKELVHINGEINAKAGIDQKFGAPLQLFAFLGFTGQVATGPEGIVVKFVDRNQQSRGDFKLRVLKAGEVGDSLFEAKGSMNAHFDFKVEVGVRVVIFNPIPGSDDIVLFEGKKVIYHKTFVNGEPLFKLASIDTRNPFNKPIPKDTQIDVIYDVNFKPGANDGQYDTIRALFTANKLHLYFNGVETETYDLNIVNSLTIIGSDDDESISVETPRRLVNVDGGAGHDVMNYDDSAWTSSTDYAITSTHLTRSRSGLNLVRYGNIEDLFVQGSYAASNSFSINQSVSAMHTVVYGGAVNDRFYLGSNGKSLDGAFTPTIIGREGYDLLYLDDSGTDRQATYGIGQDHLTRSTYNSFYSPTLDRTFTNQVSYDSLNFSGIDYVQLKGTAFGNTFFVDDANTQQIPFSIDLYTGLGADHVAVLGTTDTLNIFGQNGNDVVTVGGPGIGTRSIYGDVNITNASSITTLNVDDADDTTNRTIRMDTTTAGDRGFIYGLTGTALGGFGQSRIQYTVNDMAAINLKSGIGLFTTISVLNTASRGAGSALPTTTITTSSQGFNSVDVAGTSGDLTINAASPFTSIVIGASGNLSGINAPVTLRGRVGGLSITDSGTMDSQVYYMDDSRFYRTNLRTGGVTGAVNFGELTLASLNVTMGNGGNIATIDGTPTPLAGGFNSGISVFTGNRNDIVIVNRTNGPMSLDLGAGSYQVVLIGDATHSLDAIQSGLGVTGSGFVDAIVSDEASTQSESVYIGAHTDIFGDSQTVERHPFTSEGSGISNSFGFRFRDGGRLSYKSGGGVTTVSGTSRNVPVILNGGAGTDVFRIEPGSIGLLAPVNVNGNSAQNDFAYYDDSATASPQSYTFRGNANMIVERSGAAAVTYSGMTQIIASTAAVGGNQVRVQSTPQNLSLNMNVATGDVVTVGNPTLLPGPGNIGGNMSVVRGAVTVAGGSNVTLVLNDTAGPSGRNVILHEGLAGGGFVTGMGPGVVRWSLDETSSINVLGGRFNDTFAIERTRFDAAIHVDGGPGINTLDYTTVEEGVRVHLPSGTASGLKGGVSRIQNVIGSPFDDILTGNGGNILLGGAGRDILVAGRTPSSLIGGDGEDILIGGFLYADDADGELNVDALEALAAEWSRLDVDYATRSSTLREMLASPVFRNGGPNALLGQGGLDLFFGSKAQDAHDWNGAAGEVFVDPDATQGDIRIDAHNLSGTYFLMDYVTYTTAAPVTVNLTPGLHSVYTSGSDIVYFTVTPEGTVDYDASLEGVFTGQGTSALNVNGAAVQLDATALDALVLFMNYETYDANVVHSLRLLPGSHFLYTYSGATVGFTVANNGTVGYDASLEGVFTGQGTSALKVNGATVQIDATALDASTLLIEYVAYDANTPITAKLLPGSQFMYTYSGATVGFTVANNGTVGYDASLEGVFTGQGTSALNVNGATVQINATALDATYLFMDSLAYDANTAITAKVLPGGHYFYTYGSNVVSFNVANDGTVSYDAALEGPLSGQGTDALMLNGWSIEIDATALGNSYSALDYQSCDSSQTLPVRLLAGTHSFYKEGTTYYFTIAADGTVDYDQAMDGILAGRGTRKLTFLQMQ